MKHLTFPIVIEVDSDGYYVSCPGLQGCYSQGDTYRRPSQTSKTLSACTLRIVSRTAKSSPENVAVSLSTVEVGV
jgi:hypothetical protein